MKWSISTILQEKDLPKIVLDVMPRSRRLESTEPTMSVKLNTNVFATNKNTAA